MKLAKNQSKYETIFRFIEAVAGANGGKRMVDVVKLIKS
jgi:hypothetical protein